MTKAHAEILKALRSENRLNRVAYEKTLEWLEEVELAEDLAGGSRGCFLDKMPDDLVEALVANNVTLVYRKPPK